MKAVTYHGKRDVCVDSVPDPTIQEPTDAIVRVTSSRLCGSDLHLYEHFDPFVEVGDPKRNTARSSYPKACPTSDSCSSPMFSLPRGRRLSTRRFQTAAASPCSGLDPSVR
jgi:hypothetical protein